VAPRTKQLTVAEQLFCAHYVAQRRNARRAAELAGFAPASGARLVERPEIAAHIAELAKPQLDAAKLTMEAMLGQLAAVATFDRRRMYHSDGTRKKFHELDDETAAAISHMDANDFRPFDKLKAIDMGVKILGGYEKDNTQKKENLQIAVIFE
jgi:phage terminase small subunit